MVVPIRELVNKPFHTSTFDLQPQQMAKIPSNMDIIRGRLTSSSKLSLRELSTHSNASLVPYHEKIEAQNNILDEEIQEPIDSFQLFYTSLNEQRERSVSKAADNSLQEGAQSEHFQNEVLVLSNMPGP